MPFSPPEIYFWSQKFAMPVKTILSRLMAAGLDLIPGGGAEILHDDIRKRFLQTSVLPANGCL